MIGVSLSSSTPKDDFTDLAGFAMGARGYFDVLAECGQHPHQSGLGISAEPPAQYLGKISLIDADQFGCRRLAQAALLDKASELDHDRRFEQHILRIGQAQIRKDVAASDLDFLLAFSHGLFSLPFRQL